MKIKIFTLFLCSMFVAAVSAQERPEHLVKKVDEGPVIDGQIDEMWADYIAEPINKNFQEELPSVGDSYWKMVWVENVGIYILVVVDDDFWYPPYVDGSTSSWLYDKPEIYFDVNYILQDGGGASGEDAGNGHHQIAPPPTEGMIDGTELDAGIDGEADADDLGAKYAFLVNDPDYVVEYFIPLEILTDENGGQTTLSDPVGFDVTLCDRDEGDTDDPRKRAVWANTGVGGAATESWNSMDDCGILTFEGVGDKTYVESVEVTVSDITMNNKKMQATAVVLPEDATNRKIAWSVENGTGRATIDKSTGWITPIVDGTVTVIASVTDGSGVPDVETEITISNQIVSLSELNLIRNGFFDQVDEDGIAQQWTGSHEVIDGAMYIAAPESQLTNWWDGSTSNQQNFGCNETDMYQFSFVLWSEAPDTFYCDFEDPSNDYNRYGTSTVPEASGLSDGSEDGQSQWEFVTNVDPTKYVFDVVFNEKVENTAENLNLMAGKHGAGGIYIDSIMLINTNDLSLVSDPYKEVESITVMGAEGATTVATGGTLQMSADVMPADADYGDMVYWSVQPGTGDATIDENGMLTGDSLGSVTVVAMASDDSGIWGSLEVNVSWPEGIARNSVNTLKVYPNPAVNELNVVVSQPGVTVSIFNSVGMRMDEVVVTGTEHRFNISSYASGIYFVKTGDQVAKFVK
jgi:hypothetical protein